MTLPAIPRRYYQAPDAGEVGEIYPNSFSIILPEATTNLITNPSIELDTTGYTGVGATLSQTDEYSRRGGYCLKAVMAANEAGKVYYSQTSLAAGTHTFSLDLLGAPGYQFRIYITNTSNTLLSGYTWLSGKGFWERGSITFTIASIMSVRLYIERVSPTGNGACFYTDGWQLESKAYPTTYCDGDLVGLVPGQTAFTWTGLPHQSASTRSAQTRAGGREVKLSNLGFTVLAVIGLGLMPMTNISLPKSTGGAYYQNTVPGVREFTLAGAIYGNTRHELNSVRQNLEAALNPLLGQYRQPLVLRYQPLDDCGVASGEVLELKCVYKSGLEGGFANPSQERLGLQFQMFMPYITKESVTSFSVGFSQELDGHGWGLMFRAPNGTWSAYDTDDNQFPEYGPQYTTFAQAPNGEIWAFEHGGAYNQSYAYVHIDGGNDGACIGAFDAHGDLWLGGYFHAAQGTVGGWVHSLYNVIKYDRGTGSVAGLGDGVNALVRALVIDAAGRVYIGGDFTQPGLGATPLLHFAYYNPGGNTWEAEGQPNGNVRAMVIGKDNKVYIGGQFTQLTEMSLDAPGFARFDRYTDTWEALASIEAGRYITQMVVASDNTIYALDDTKRVIYRFNGTSWAGINSAANYPISQIVLDSSDNLWVAGGFTELGGIPTGNGLVMYNRSTWVPATVTWPPPWIGITRMYATGVGAFKDGTVVANLSATTSLDFTGAGPTETVIDAGAQAVQPRMVIYGSGHLLELRNSDTNQTIYFDLWLAQDEVATLDLEAGTFVSNFRGNIINTIRAGSDLSWQLLPGSNHIALFMDGTDNNTPTPRIEFNAHVASLEPTSFVVPNFYINWVAPLASQSVSLSTRYLTGSIPALTVSAPPVGGGGTGYDFSVLDNSGLWTTL